VLCHWYFFERKCKELINGERKYQIEVFIVTFTLAIMTHIFVCVIPPPQYENEHVIVPPHVVADLHKFLASLIWFFTQRPLIFSSINMPSNIYQFKSIISCYFLSTVLSNLLLIIEINIRLKVIFEWGSDKTITF
jgi:membrane-associated HD superfamily phosphohydrolase